ncbi:hypothetical protein C2W62_45350 [Candidatus Entotheonella serta]|nr:hypothetical protein C2W62_45350 [Candidatus Entotheonella serta]
MIHVIERTSSGPTLLVKSDAIIPAHYRPSLDLERLKATLDERISDAVQQVGAAKRAQVFRDLVLVARADADVRPAERAELDHIGHGLELGESLIGQQVELD